MLAVVELDVCSCGEMELEGNHLLVGVSIIGMQQTHCCVDVARWLSRLVVI